MLEGIWDDQHLTNLCTLVASRARAYIGQGPLEEEEEEEEGHTPHGKSCMISPLDTGGGGVMAAVWQG